MVTIERLIKWKELEERLRQTPLLEPRDGHVVYPYEDAVIQLETVTYDKVAPTSLYVLRQNLATQAMLSAVLAEKGYHPLELEGGLILKNTDGKEIGLIPPIVEYTFDEGQYILDGIHRTSIGRWLGRTNFIAIHVSGIRPDCPSYAIPNSWDDVRIVEEVPVNDSDKKHYRGENYRSLYRDFSLLNGSALRELRKHESF